MIEFGEFRYDPESRFLYRGDEEISLPPRALAVLESFLKRPGKVVKKDDILESAWDGAFVGEDSLTQAVSMLRAALGDDPQRPRYIQTIPKRGYRFVAEVSAPLRRDASIEPAGAEVLTAFGDVRPAEPAPSEAPPSVSDPASSEVPPPVPDPAPEREEPAPAGAVQPINPGNRLGGYEVVSRIGAGAMGEVWRAKDIELGRHVAIKVVPPGLAEDEQILRRFRREAQMLAAVNHPNIATIHGVEESDGVRFIVMEYLRGETIDERMDGVALPINEALRIALQVAQALEAAHRKDIVHRDLKPGNVMVTSDNRVKVLDFGLAKEVRPTDPDLTQDSTSLTKSGVLLGTAPYMCPEQVRGQRTDKRSDVWAFGCLLYELLSGDSPFRKETVADTMAAILDQDPDWSALPDETPPTLRALLRRCLSKDPDRRLHAIADARIEIEESLDEPEAVLDALDTSTQGRRIPLGLAAAAVVAVALVSALAVWVVVGPRAPEPPRVQEFTFPVDPSSPHAAPWRMDLSRDGSQIVYQANLGEGDRLYLRAFDEAKATQVPDVVDAYSARFSPSGDWLLYQQAREMWKMRLPDGAPRKIYPHDLGNIGAEWESEDSILIVEEGSIWRISADGADVEDRELVAEPNPADGIFAYAAPSMLPDGKGVVLELRNETGDASTAAIGAISFDTGVVTRIVQRGNDPLYSPTGHILYARGTSIEAVPFSLERFEVLGPAVTVPLEEGVLQYSWGQSEFDLSNNGVLVLVPGPSLLGPAEFTRLLWVDREGNEEPVDDELIRIIVVRLSPDGRRIAAEKQEGDEWEIWLFDLEGGTWSRLTDDSNGWPLWTPDGERVVFGSGETSIAKGLFWRSADFSDEPDVLLPTDAGVIPSSWSGDGSDVVLQEGFQQDRKRILLMPIDGDRTPRAILDSEGHLDSPAVSPDGRWIAYVSDQSGRREVYVRAFPGGGARTKISADGGNEPVWGRDATEVFYRDGSYMVAAQLQTEPAFRVIDREPLFGDVYDDWTLNFTIYDYDPRSDRFLMGKEIAGEGAPVHVIVNFFEELKRLAPIEH